MNTRLILSAALLFLAVTHAHADEAQIAVAANFAGPAQKIAAEFEKQTGHKTILITGSTGKFYAQIVNGAPFDILLSADDETPARLEKENQAIAGKRYTYAIGKLVLWSAKPVIVDEQGEVLKRASFNHIAIANPKVAPYGQAAVEVMKAVGAYETLQTKIVMGENIAQTHQFVASGNALLGFVALSQVLKDGKIEGSYWIVPEKLYTPIRQDTALLNKGKDNKAAAAFLEFLKGRTARDIILNYGYSL